MVYRYALGIGAFVMSLLLCTSAFGQAQISQTKRQLIHELIQLSGGAQAFEQMTQVMLRQMQKSHGAMVQSVIASQPQLSPADKAKIKSHLGRFDRFSEKFSARFPQRIKFSEIVETVYIPLYDKYFEEKDLREIVAFYKTPAGRKVVSVMPRLMQESMQASMPIIQPRVSALVQEIIAEEQAEALR